MLPGPTYIYQCPKCDNLISKGSITSGNTFGSITYSDGKTVAPMMPGFPDLTKCSRCGIIFWFDKVIIAGEHCYNNANGYISYNKEKYSTESLKNAEEAKFLSVDDYLIALRKNIYNTVEEECYIRKRLWWGFNDKIRDNDNLDISAIENEDHWKENILRLLKIIDSSTINNVFMKAELYRNLGKFTRSLRRLEGLDLKDHYNNESMQATKEKIYSAAKTKERAVSSLLSMPILTEYRCDKCDHEIILWDLKKNRLDSYLKYYKCIPENELFLLKIKELITNNKAPEDTNSIEKDIIKCPSCNTTEVEIFNPLKDKCIMCGEGSYKHIKWF